MYAIDLPLRVKVTKTKFHTLNLNVYRNAHFFELNKAKKEFKEAISNVLKLLPVMSGCTLEYVLYPKTGRKTDLSNVCSIVDKFFCDAMVEAGKIEDDNYLNIARVAYSFGAVDPLNPRVTVLITPKEK